MSHPVIFFASGQGSNIRAILAHFKTIPLLHPALIVCNKADAGATKIAEEQNIPLHIIDRQNFKSVEFLEILKSYNPSLLILAGFLWKIPTEIISAFPNKIINIHPALLPQYGGKGMYGMHVHEAIINNKEKESGITIHYVNENYDEGNHICQAHCTVDVKDTPEMLANKIHELEHFYFPRVIEFLLQKASN
jgi:phosphoribosylglycinamide formyltransferase-1